MKKEIRDILSRHDDLLMLNLSRGQRKKARQRLKQHQMQAIEASRKPSVEIHALTDPLKHKDLQLLISHVLQPYVHTIRPDWCQLQNPRLVKKTVVVMVSYLTANHVSKHSDCFPTLLKIFPQVKLPRIHLNICC